MGLYFITENKNKFAEASKDLDPIKIEQKKIDLPEIQSLDPKEVIECKLREAQKLCAEEFFIEDASISLTALNGFPGPFAKWLVKAIGVKGIFELCKSLDKFGVQMKAIIGYSNGKEVFYFEGTVEGVIVEPTGESDFGWDPIFMPNGFTKTFAQMTKQEKNKISHRGRALKKFKEYYLKK